MNPETIEPIKRKLLIPSAGNRPCGSGTSAAQIKELAASIAEKGIRQPLIVREHPTKKGHYEVTNGHRRLAAAERLDLAELPCIVRVLTDREAKEERIIENLQREGLHEIEEARLYQELLDETDAEGKPAYDYKLIARKIGKSPAFVYARIKLLRMPELAQDAMMGGKLNASVALLLCRIPDPKLAHKATCEVLDRLSGKEENALNDDWEPMSYRQAKEHIQRKYMIRLKGAAFDQADELLVPEYNAEGKDIAEGGERGGGGACSSCPFRTGNMKVLFPEAESADVCTNTPCYQKKVAAAQKRETEKFKSQGQTLLKPKQAANLLTYDGTQLNDRARVTHLPLNEKVPGKKKTWGELLEKEGIEHEVVVAKAASKSVPLTPISAALAAAVSKAGVELAAPAAEPTDDEIAAAKAEAAATRELMEGVVNLAAEQLSKAVRLAKHADLVRAYVGSEFLSQGGTQVTQKMVKKMDDRELFAELFMTGVLFSPLSYQGELREEYVKLAAEFDVDVKAIVKEAKQAAADAVKK